MRRALHGEAFDPVGTESARDRAPVRLTVSTMSRTDASMTA